MNLCDVSIILVNYNTYDLTKNCIESIYACNSQLKYEIIVVDNSNTPLLLNQLIKQYPLVKFIDSKTNLGFGKANNLGSKYANGKYLFFLNTDTLLINNAFDILYDFMEKNEKAIICGPNIYTRELAPNHSFYFKKKNLKNDRNNYSLLHTLYRKFCKKRDDFNYSTNPIIVDGYVCGAALMISKADFIEIGGFEKEIFMYAEEALLCYKATKDFNRFIYNIPSSKIIHFEGASFEGSTLKRSTMIVDGNYLYYRIIYGEKIALKYLKTMKSIFKNKMLISKFFNKKKYIYFSNMYKAYSNKYSSLVH